MVPRRKLINQVDAKAICTRGVGKAGDAPVRTRALSRTLISPSAETPISNGPGMRPRVDAQAATTAMIASNASAGSNRGDETAAITSARNDANAMASATRRQRRARVDGCSAVHGTNKWLDPLEHKRAVGAAEPE